MKNSIIIAGLLSVSALVARETMFIHKSDLQTLGAKTAQTDSVYFSTDKEIMYLNVNGQAQQFATANIDSLTFSDNTTDIYITYLDDRVSVINPLAFEGVDVAVSASQVTVTSSYEDEVVSYHISGETPDGCLKIYSSKKFNLKLEGVDITNPEGPAINIQSGKTARVEICSGTENLLADGTTYAAAPLNSDGEEEDQKATFFAEGDLKISGEGTLEITSNAYTHAIASDDITEISGGNIKITAAQRNAIVGKDGVEITGGTLNLNLAGNAVLEADGSGYDPTYPTGIKSDGNINIADASITIKTTGKGNKGISADSAVNITSGTIEITASGNGATYTNSEGTADAYRSTCIKADGNVNISGGKVTLSNSGTAGMGINSDANINIYDGTINITTTGAEIVISENSQSGPGGGWGDGSTADAAEAKAIKADSNVTVSGGTLNISSADDGIKAVVSVNITGGEILISKSIEGIEAPNITISGGNTAVNASDDAINGTYGNGGEANDGSQITVSDGRLVLNSTKGDAMDSNGNLTISGGVVIAHGPSSQPEIGVDVNGTFKINGGFLVVSEVYSQQSQSAVGSSTQYSVSARSGRTINANTLFHVEDSSGNTILTFQPVRNYSKVTFSSPDLTKGTYKIFTGGTCTGENQDGLYSGGTYSGGTEVKSFTISNTTTSVSW